MVGFTIVGIQTKVRSLSSLGGVVEARPEWPIALLALGRRLVLLCLTPRQDGLVSAAGAQSAKQRVEAEPIEDCILA